MLKVHKKWAEGVLFLWYPVLDDGLHAAMLDMLKSADLPKLYNGEVRFKGVKEGMKGSGIVIVNTPYGGESELDAIKDWF